jgi:hypothetical protein
MNSEKKIEDNITLESFKRNFSNSLEKKKSEKFLLQQFQSVEKKRVSCFFSGFDGVDEINYNNNNENHFTCPKAPKL